MANVYAFQPRHIDPPAFIAEDREELADMVGGFIGGGQCDGCGNSTYLIVRESENVFRAECKVDPSDDPAFAHPEPCGALYRINLYEEDLVAF